jgi:hypothetical protein
MFLFFGFKCMRTRRRNEEYVLALLLLFFIFVCECVFGVRIKMRWYLLFERKAGKCWNRDERYRIGGKKRERETIEWHSCAFRS